MLKSVSINYITYPEKAEENKQLIEQVFHQLQEQKLEGIKYAVFKMGENVFVHLAQFESEEANEVFRTLPAFRAFQKNINGRLISKPITTPMMEIGTFSTFHTQPTQEGLI